jgi:hypothetical protein
MLIATRISFLDTLQGELVDESNLDWALYMIYYEKYNS